VKAHKLALCKTVTNLLILRALSQEKACNIALESINFIKNIKMSLRGLK